MGCDIHMYKEKLVGGVWVTADEWTPYDYGEDERGMEVEWKNRFRDRNYYLFSILAKGVRGEEWYSFLPRGLPQTVCNEVYEASESYGEDGHNHSHLYLHELKDFVEWAKDQEIQVSGMKDPEGLAKLQNSEPKDWNLLYPYCGWTTQENYVRFEIDVPLQFLIGESFQKLIDMFDGVDGDNHRIVFWFDN